MSIEKLPREQQFVQEDSDKFGDLYMLSKRINVYFTEHHEKNTDPAKSIEFAKNATKEWQETIAKMSHFWLQTQILLDEEVELTLFYTEGTMVQKIVMIPTWMADDMRASRAVELSMGKLMLGCRPERFEKYKEMYSFYKAVELDENHFFHKFWVLSKKIWDLTKDTVTTPLDIIYGNPHFALEPLETDLMMRLGILLTDHVGSTKDTRIQGELYDWLKKLFFSMPHTEGHFFEPNFDENTQGSLIGLFTYLNIYIEYTLPLYEGLYEDLDSAVVLNFYRTILAVMNFAFMHTQRWFCLNHPPMLAAFALFAGNCSKFFINQVEFYAEGKDFEGEPEKDLNGNVIELTEEEKQKRREDAQFLVGPAKNLQEGIKLNDNRIILQRFLD